MSTKFHCNECKTSYPNKIVHICPECGGIFGIDGVIDFKPELIENGLPGIWKYRHSFGLPKNAEIISLGEGNTALIESSAFDTDIYFKTEYQNPTGSFKDRLTSPEISYLKSSGITDAVEDSSGNAGASFAAYSQRANIKGKVFIPSYASGPKKKQIEAYGVPLELVEGPRSAAAIAVKKAVKEGATYASHAYLPFGLPGLATIAYELVEQLGSAPGSVLAPVGHGSLLLGLTKGFEALKNIGEIDRFPQLIGVQAKACAPIYQQWDGNSLDQNVEGETLAEGVRVLNPVAGKELIAMSRHLPIKFIAVEEKMILSGRDEIASLGFYVEVTSAIVWDALRQTINQLPKPVVVILTGSGLKS